MTDLQQQRAETNGMADNQITYNFNSNDREESKSIAKQYYEAAAAQHHKAETNAISNLYVDLGGDQPDNFTSNMPNVVILPTGVGALSPRLVEARDKSLDPSLNPLNIDQSVVDVNNGRQTRGKGVRIIVPSDRQLRSTTSFQNSFRVLSND